MTLSIIVIEYKSLDDIKLFQEQVKQSVNGVDYELIVSSNSQYSISLQESIRKQFPDIIWVFNERNGGFAYGMNRGLELATGEYLMIANSDLHMKKGLAEAIYFLQENPDVGAVGPLIKDNKGVIQDSARPYVTLYTWVIRQLKRLLGKNERYNLSKTQTVDWVIGACILMSRKAYLLTGGLDEHYFMYAEDLDLCTRIRENNLEVVYYPQMEVEYAGTRSARHSLKYARIFLQSHWHYWKQYGFLTNNVVRKVIIFDN